MNSGLSLRVPDGLMSYTAARERERARGLG